MKSRVSGALSGCLVGSEIECSPVYDSRGVIVVVADDITDGEIDDVIYVVSLKVISPTGKVAGDVIASLKSASCPVFKNGSVSTYYCLV